MLILYDTTVRVVFCCQFAKPSIDTIQFFDEKTSPSNFSTTFFYMPRLFRPPNPDTPVSKLWNMSDISGSWLNDIGVFTYADLVSRDILQLWADLKSTHKQVTKLMYYALWGATANTHWKNIPADQIKRIDDFAKSFKPKASLLTKKKVTTKKKSNVKSLNLVKKVVK